MRIHTLQLLGRSCGLDRESCCLVIAKGTFTGALSDQLGLIRSAENGTLFLDEIGDLPLALQPKLLGFFRKERFIRSGIERRGK